MSVFPFSKHLADGTILGSRVSWSNFHFKRYCFWAISSDLGPLHTCYSYVATCGIPNSGIRACLWLFCWLLEPYFSYWLALPILNTREVAQSYCKLICHDLISMEDLPFLNRNGEAEDEGQRERRGTLRRGGRRSWRCKINKKLKNKVKMYTFLKYEITSITKPFA